MGELQPGTGVDPLNDLLQLFAPALLFTAVVPTPQGSVGLLTIRTPSTTVTVTLSKEDAAKWAEHVSRWAASIPAAGLIAPPPSAGALIVPRPGPNGGKDRG